MYVYIYIHTCVCSRALHASKNETTITTNWRSGLGAVLMSGSHHRCHEPPPVSPHQCFIYCLGECRCSAATLAFPSEFRGGRDNGHSQPSPTDHPHLLPE